MNGQLTSNNFFRTMTGVSIALALIIAALTWWPGIRLSIESPDATYTQPQAMAWTDVIETEIPPQPQDQSSSATSQFVVEKDEMQCRVRYSYDNDRSQQAMAVLNQSAAGAEFSIFSDGGLQVSDELDFAPDMFQVSLREDESIVALFAKTIPHLTYHQEGNLEKPLRVYFDNQIIYETNKVLTARLNSSGSAWFAVEPQAGDTSRLIIGNIDTGELHVHDIGYLLNPPYHEMSPFPNFTEDGAFISIGSTVTLEDTVFYPIDGGKPGYVVFPDEPNYSFPLFESAGTYYRLYADEEERYIVKKLRIDPWSDSENRTVQNIWSTTLDVQDIAGLEMSDGWLVVDGWEEQVLNPDTGEVVFNFPMVDNPDAARERLKDVSDFPDTDDDIGHGMGIDIIGDELIIERSFKYHGNVRDIFPIKDGKISHYPIRREPVEAGPCAS